MSKALAIAGMVVSALVFLIFALDLAIGFPFQAQERMTAITVLDIIFVIGAAILGFLSFTTFRELK